MILLKITTSSKQLPLDSNPGHLDENPVIKQHNLTWPPPKCELSASLNCVCLLFPQSGQTDKITHIVYSVTFDFKGNKLNLKCIVLSKKKKKAPSLIAVNW